MDYRFFSSGDGSDMADGVGGLMAITPDMAAGGAMPCWLGYIGVDDVDTSVSKITAAGGAVLMPAMDLEGVGRMAMVSDAQGAAFHVMTVRMMTPAIRLRARPPKWATARGMSFQRLTPPPPLIFTPRSSAGSRKVRWTWGQWANICSFTTAPA